jgi:hypothetical protein
MMLFVAQNKRRSNVHKENNTKIENIERYKNFTHCDKLNLIKKLVHDLTIDKSSYLVLFISSRKTQR